VTMERGKSPGPSAECPTCQYRVACSPGYCPYWAARPRGRHSDLRDAPRLVLDRRSRDPGGERLISRPELARGLYERLRDLAAQLTPAPHADMADPATVKRALENAMRVPFAI